MLRPLRHRLVVALVALSAGSVLAAGLLVAAFASRAARVGVERDLRQSLGGLAVAEAAGEPLLAAARLRPILRLQGIEVVSVGERGRIRGRLPAGVSAADLDVPALSAGQVEAGHHGRLVFVAQPLSRREAGGRPVVVATRRSAPFDRIGGVLVAAAAAASAAALVVSVWLAGRLTRPLAAMERTARAIAGGDFSARVGAGADTEGELAALASAIDAMAEELERARGTERAFLMSVSHDLRTPLTSIRGYAEAIGDATIDDEAGRRQAAGIIGAEAERLERLVTDLLDLARLDTRQFSLRPVVVDAAEVVTRAALALEPAARAAGVDIAAAAPDGPLPATLDPERLGQVVANLVENALRYAASGVRVEVRRTSPPGTEGTSLLVTVTDDGPGIAPDERSRVFDRLYTAGRDAGRDAGRKVGTGLGLAIVRELTAAMGGTVTVDDRPGGGSRFTVAVPGVAAPLPRHA